LGEGDEVEDKLRLQENLSRIARLLVSCQNQAIAPPLGGFFFAAFGLGHLTNSRIVSVYGRWREKTNPQVAYFVFGLAVFISLSR
jgi:hypothetical protein